VTCSDGSAAYGNAGLLILCGHLQEYLTHVRAVLLEGFALLLQSSCGCVSVPAFLTKTLLQGFVAQRVFRPTASLQCWLRKGGSFASGFHIVEGRKAIRELSFA
jgi:hypothetical protein